jgi:hypothetical protein
MSANKKIITVGQYNRIKRLMRTAQSEISSLYRTKNLIAGMLPQEPGLGINVDYAVDHSLSTAALLRLMGVRVKGKR